jgi:hypothetical protein
VSRFSSVGFFPEATWLLRMFWFVALLLLSFCSENYAQVIDKSLTARRLLDLIEDRSGLESMLVVAVAKDPAYTIRFTTKIQGSLIRTDREYLAFKANPSQVGDRDKVVIRDGKLFRKHSVYGAELKNANSPFNTQVNVRLLGLSPSPMVGLKSETSVEQTLLGQLAKGIETASFEKEIFQSVECVSISVVREDKAVLKAFFDPAYRYRGCSIKSGDYFDWVFIEEFEETFPTLLHVKMTKAGEDVFDEVLTVERVVLNPKINASDFEWNGLGVQEGELVDVRDGSLENGKFIKGILKNGQLVPASSDDISKVPGRHDTFQKKTKSRGQVFLLLGSCVLIFAAITMFLLFRKKTE